MQVLSRFFGSIAACWRLPPPPALRVPEVIPTTRTPDAAGQWMAVADVARKAAPRPPVQQHKRAPRKWERHTCTVNHFVWKNPSKVTPDALQTYYAGAIARQGTYGGYLEAEILGHQLGVRVGLWDRPLMPYFRWLATLGVDKPAAPIVHLVNVGGVHWRALVPPAAPDSDDACWTELEAGGGGDCLFHAMHAAAAAHPALAAPPSAAELRRSCAEFLAGGAEYQERIVSLSEQAWSEWGQRPAWDRALCRLGVDVRVF